jgi:hypothetical protein
MDTLIKILNEFKASLISEIREEFMRHQQQSKPHRITSTDYCREMEITRQTLYQWRDKGLIKTEKIGGKNYVIEDSVVRKKYQRKPLE